MTLSRRALLSAAVAVPFLAACKKGKPKAQPTPSGPVALEDVGGTAANVLDVGDAESELVVGASRYAFGLVEQETGPVAGARATVYVGTDPQQPPTTTAPATELTDAGLTGRGLYVAHITFPRAGTYYVAVVAQTDKGTLKGGTRVDVAAKSKSPAVGQHVPVIKTPTTKDLRGANPLCSLRPKPCGMHAISLDAALKNGKPTVLVFAAPAFCQTELCGPDVQLVQKAAAAHAGKANFIHIEAYTGATNPTDGNLAPALKAFHFDSEPWLYVVDAKGLVSTRISGAFGGDELAAALAKVGVS